MKTISGLIVVDEPLGAMPILIVHVFSLQRDQSLEALDVESRWDTLHASNWRLLNATRIGSTMAKADGRFEFDYDPDHLHLDATPNIWLVVTGVSRWDEEPAPKVVYVGYERRDDSGAHEAFQVMLSHRRLARLGIIDAAVVSSSLTTGVREALVTRLSAVAPEPLPPGTRFSTVFNQRQGANDETAHRPRSHRLAAPIGLDIESRGDLDRKSIGRGPNGGLVLIDASGAQQALRFEGVRRARHSNRNDGQRNEVGVAALRIDANEGTYALSLPHVPDTLRKPDPKPSALLAFALRNTPR